jgi:hypothetical protein
MSENLVKILDGNTFVVSDTRGDIEASPADPTGLFSFDTRFLSWCSPTSGHVYRATVISANGEKHESAKLARARGRQNMEANLVRWIDEAPPPQIVRQIGRYNRTQLHRGVAALALNPAGADDDALPVECQLGHATPLLPAGWSPVTRRAPSPSAGRTRPG